ncbi:MAG: glucosidase [Pirellulales bacterium]|nr:glucosidase [Pirellulales bacterium]
MNAEKLRLEEHRLRRQNWRQWGPYLSERQWGTVREDYSPHGTAWDYFPHDMARSRAYRWGEDGIAGFSDDKQRLCLALALWNGRDPILKERLFGLTNSEGNHGEDVKEIYYYLDATPSHSYQKMLYKYPQREFPYAWLVEENRRRTKQQMEFELLDTGVFDDDRYFDVFVEYAKASPRDMLIEITIANRGPDAAELHVLPQLWYRNVWSWGSNPQRPVLEVDREQTITARHELLGTYQLFAPAADRLLFCDNETNVRRLFGMHDAHGYFKDAFHEYVVQGNHSAVNPMQCGTKSAAYYRLNLPPHGETKLRLRLAENLGESPLADFESIMHDRRGEADQFYNELERDLHDPENCRVQRQALAGMLWSKQFFYFDVAQWLHGDAGQPAPPPERLHARNSEWQHMHNAEVLSMPDKWEYPWYAAWDLAFHTIALALVDAEFAKSQLLQLTRTWYMHPNGQLPAYEWAFSDTNPPVHAWAAWRVFQIDRRQRGGPGDIAFLERILHKLLLNFTWWVNRKDANSRNVFQGGFLGMDNVGAFDRSAPLPPGMQLDQADGTSWMGMYCLNLMRIALELALHNPVYQDIATKFFEHFLSIAEAMTNMGNKGIGLWDEQDEFYFDVLTMPNGKSMPLKIHSMVGLIPLFAVETLEPDMLEKLPQFRKHLEWYLTHRPDLANLVSHWEVPGRGRRRLLSLLRGHRMKCLLRRMLDESAFLSDYGVRSLSRKHLQDPYVVDGYARHFEVGYEPGESECGLFGGNSNWRGPIWFPVNFLIVESLQKFHHYYGDDFKVECPTGSGKYITINEVAEELTRRLERLFLRDANGRRPSFGPYEKMQTDPHFRDYLLFFEHFHGDSGRGLGASHQTGWTGLVGKLLQPRRAPAPNGASNTNMPEEHIALSEIST